jgi:deoxyribose-phosphate aldolase
MTTRTPQETARIALACLDLTSLNDEDTEADVTALCQRASGAFGAVAAVCVWPRFARLACDRVPPGVRVAAVANFPDGSNDIERTRRDVDAIVRCGAHEVDVVLPWRAILAGDEAACAALLRAVRRDSEGLTLKVILETGELHDPARIEQAARIALGEGADFLKTSSGKTPVSATLEAADVMLRVIAADASARSRVGFKASGGIRTVAAAAPYIDAVARTLGTEALTPARFRIGASSLLSGIETVLAGAAHTPAKPPDDSY